VGRATTYGGTGKA